MILRYSSLVLFVVILSLGGGWVSVDYVLKHFEGFSPLTIGVWRAYPDHGTASADPYARARAIRLGRLALGRAEGLSFYLWHDDQGRRLKATCHYQLAGHLPVAQFFTLYAIGQDMMVRRSTRGRPDILTSYNTLRGEEGDYLIAISPQPQSGNWLATEGEESYGLILTLYHSPIGVATGLSQPVMPILQREGAC